MQVLSYVHIGGLNFRELLRPTGEYTGMVQREMLMKQQENNRMCTTGSPPEGYNYTYAGGCKNNYPKNLGTRQPTLLSL